MFMYTRCAGWFGRGDGMKGRPNAGLMVCQRRRRWHTINPTLGRILSHQISNQDLIVCGHARATGNYKGIDVVSETGRSE